jgi:hypothetical protein
VEEAGVTGERTTNHGQATGKLYHLRVECTIFVIFQQYIIYSIYWYGSIIMAVSFIGGGGEAWVTQ